MQLNLSAAQIGKIVKALQVNCKQDYDAYEISVELMSNVKNYLDDMPYSGLFEDWLREFDISTALIPSNGK